MSILQSRSVSQTEMGGSRTVSRSMSGPRVLHVDDDREFLTLTAEMLDRVAGIETVTELDPTAVPDRLAADEEIECVLCDYEMPGWTGVDVLEAVRDEHPDLPFVLYTGKGNESVAADVVALGAADYIQKGRGRDHFETVAERIDRAISTGDGDDDTRTGSLVENAPFPVVSGWLSPDDGGFEVWDLNPTAAATFGVDRERLRGESLDRFPAVAPRSDSGGRSSTTVGSGVADAIADGDSVRVDARLTTVEGERSFLVTVVPATSGPAERSASSRGESEVFAWGVYVDVSERAVDRDRLTTLQESALALGSAATPAAVHEATVDAASGVLSFDRCVLYHERGGVLEPVATAGTDLSAADPRPTESGVAGHTYSEREAVRVDDARAHPTATATDGVGSLICVPVGRWGVLLLAADTTAAFSPFDRELAYTLGAHAAAALDRVAREQATRGYRRRLTRLHEATRALMSADSLEEAAADAITVAVDLLDPSLCAVHRYDPDADRLHVLTRRGTTDDIVPVARDVGEGLVGRAFERETTLRVSSEGELLAASGGGRDTEDETVSASDTAEPPTGEQSAEPPTGEQLTPDGVAAAVAYPLGEHGVLCLYADTDRPSGERDAEADRVFDSRTVQLGRVLADNLEAVLDRLVGERALHRREAQLERQNERLERFASLVSHDLRSPLQVVRGNVELARIQDDPDYLDEALAALDRADELIEDMLTFARQGDHVTEVTPVGLQRVAEAAWPAARTETDADTDGELVCDTTCRVRADESRLRQLLENLFRNALEHNDEPVTVRVCPTEDGFAVEDDGVGLPSVSVAELFDPGTSTREGGTGFGLSIVREIADAHGWTVAAGESETGGARFEFVTDPTP